jgi:NDP-4-keto-2,6-dideoxyhexose 3-C-methyltransferase
MDDNTIWILQMTYLGTMLEGNIFDNIVHEHTAYYSLSSLEALLSRVGLHIAEARIVESYGGSIRVHIVKDPALYPKEKYRKEYTSVRQFELDNKTNTFEALYAFNSRTKLLKKTIRSILNHLIDESGPVWGFGASTKGNMLLQFLDVGSDQIPCILDNSQKKIGKYTTGSMIPIIDERVNLECLPKYLFVLPYYYVHAFVEIIRKKLRTNQQVHLFVPLPQPYFITLKGI